MLSDIPKVYEPHAVEKTWWQAWENSGLFTPPDDPGKLPVYSIVIPPPNVTGSLHMGHALNNTLQDILIRFHRMEGQATLWVFGMDHAGIATQNVVERQLRAEGKTRNDLGRDAFVQRVWKWKEESGGTIRHQLKKLGCSLDYKNERFTMDEGLSRAVGEVFVKLYEEGKIYRAQRLINWCPRCQTALSDLEVEHQEIASHLWHIRYPLEADPQDCIVVATTRPETLLGDTAVAVHPEDARYKHLIGMNIELPFVGRLIPILADAAVDPAFGTGAVKVTPAHDFNDFEMGNRHGLERVNVFTEAARMNEFAGPFAGQDRMECRTNLVKALEEQGLLVKVEDYKTSVGHCYRCKTVVEPYLSMQWFLKMAELAKPAIAAVKEGQTRIIPRHWENTYFNWMENIRDWCISRQIWWGHRIPVWYCGRCADEERPGGGVIVSRHPLERCPQCGHNDLRQESDVLDTWFSSALWPFSTLGWPEETPKLKSYYPTSTLVTGFDILFFWVARMLMMGLHFTGKVPFRDVYIHALIRDAQGQKMSKSKGNVIDPLFVMEKYGTDAFRFTLAAFAAQGRDIKLSEERILGYRNFCNKIWNAARFVISSTTPFADAAYLQQIDFDLRKIEAKNDRNQWILARLSQAIEEIRGSLSEYRFNDAAMSFYHFFWGTFCDWYIELIKFAFKEEEKVDAELRKEFGTVALFVLDQSLRLLHPFMPFISEELWQRVTPREGTLLASSAYPHPLSAERRSRFAAAEARMEAVTAIVDKVRQIRKEAGLPESQVLTRASLYSSDPDFLSQIDAMIHEAANLTRVAKFARNDEVLKKEKGIAKGVTRFRDLVVLVDLKGVVDLQKERQRQEKELAKLKNGLDSTLKMLENEDFVAKAPPELIEEKRAAEANYRKKIQEVQEALDLL
ncbi:MAG TPA: valine--tRNA ligase [Deltaproteobacteria bacterium]|nr:valine--tRNA ligase [Deltaproteobacteria bacterium]